MDNDIRPVPIVPNGSKSFHDALELAAQDETFAKALIANPAGFRDEYALTDEHIAAIASANETAVLQYAGDTSLGYEFDN
jgi:hypothetical protein